MLLRKLYREKRQSIPLMHRHIAALNATQLFIDSELFVKSTNIALYFATEVEFDTETLINAVCLAEKKCYVPVLTAEKSLFFVQYEKNDALTINHLGIKEPKDQSRKIALQDLDLVLMPLIAFDKYGHRLGSGGGYYDRTFAEFISQKKEKPIFIGLGYAVQEVEALPQDVWDIKMSAMLTEDGLMEAEEAGDQYFSFPSRTS